MSIVYPLAFPSGASFSQCSFDLRVTEAVNVLPGGAVLAAELGDPLWTGKFVSGLCGPHQRARWQAWRASLRGSIGTFLGFDPDKAYPLAYGEAVLGLTRAGGGAFDGTATLDAATAGSLTLSGLPADYEVRAGDMLSFAWSASRALHMVVADAQADAGGVLEVEVMPPVLLSPAPAEDAVVDLVRPACLMRIVPGSFSAPAARQSTTVSFEAVQVIG